MNRRILLTGLAVAALLITVLILWLGTEGAELPQPGDLPLATTPSLGTTEPASQLPATSPSAIAGLAPSLTKPEAAVPWRSDLAARRAAGEPLRDLTVRGRLVDGDGRPVAGANLWFNHHQGTRLRLEQPEHFSQSPVPWSSLPNTRSDSEGRFALESFCFLAENGLPTPPPTSQSLTNDSCLITFHPAFAPAAERIVLSGLEAAVTPGSNNAPHWEVDVGELALQPGGSLSGRVLDASGAALGGARVHFPWGGRESDQLTSLWALTQSLFATHTQADGSFLLSPLPPGSYRLEVLLPGYGPAYPTARLQRDDGAVFLTPVDDTPPVPAMSADVGDVVLPNSSLLRGHVVDESGQSIPGAQLKARVNFIRFLSGGEDTALRDMGAKITYQSGQSDIYQRAGPDGSFRFDILTPDTPYDLFASAPGKDTVVLRALNPPVEDLRLVLPQEALFVLHLVDDDTGEPIAEPDAAIRRQSVSVESGLSMNDPLLTVRSGQAALAALRQLRTGVPNDDKDEQTTSATGLLLVGPAGPLKQHARFTSPLHAPLEMELPGLPPGTLQELEVRLRPGSSLSGTAVDEYDMPLEGVEVRVRNGNPRDTRVYDVFRAYTDVDGAFTVLGLFESNWLLEASKPGHESPLTLPFTLGAAEARQHQQLRLPRGARAAGVLLTADGRPARAQMVWAVSPATPDRPATEQKTHTTADGRFSFDGLSPGLVSFRAHPGGRAEVQVLPEGVTEVELRLQQLAEITGKVTDAQGSPVSAKLEFFYDTDRGWPDSETQSNEQGVYRLRDLRAGHGKLVALQGSAQTPAQDITLNYGDTLQQDLRFGDARIEGRVLTGGDSPARASPLAGVRVLAVRMDGDMDQQLRDGTGLRRLSGRGTSDSAGRYRIDKLVPGLYSLTTVGRDYLLADSSPIEVQIRGQRGTSDLIVVPAATLTGSITTNGKPQSGNLRLLLERVDQPGTRTTTISFEGSYSVKGLAEGSYRYRVTRPLSSIPAVDQYHVFAIGSVTLSSGESTQHDIVLMPSQG